jgi:hypothetical protein
MFGRVRMYEASFLVFVLGSLTCALVAREDMIAGHVCFPAAGRHRQGPWSPPGARSGPGIGDHRPY